MLDHDFGTIDFNNHPAILIFSDSEQGSATLSNAADVAGARIVANGSIDEALARIDRQVAMAAVMLDLTRDHGSRVDHLLFRLEALSEIDAISVIVNVPIALLDTVSQHATSRRITILCDPEPADLIAALMLSLGKRTMMFADVTTEIDSARLRRLADEVGRIARALSSISSHNSSPGPSGSVNDMHTTFSAQPRPGDSDDMLDAADVRRLIRARRLRDSYFDAALFADPAWDMLLDLYAAHLDEDRVAVSSLCIAASVPPTTALRWIKAMTDTGLFERHADPDDGRRIFIRLSSTAVKGMTSYFSAAKRAGGWAV